MKKLIFLIIFLTSLISQISSANSEIELSEFLETKDNISLKIPFIEIDVNKLEKYQAVKQIDFIKAYFLNAYSTNNFAPSIDVLASYSLLIEFAYNNAGLVSLDSPNFYIKYEYFIKFYEHILRDEPIMLALTYEYFAILFRAEFTTDKNNVFYQSNLKGTKYLEKSVNLWDQVIINEVGDYKNIFIDSKVDEIDPGLGSIIRPQILLLQNYILANELAKAKKIESNLLKIIEGVPEKYLEQNNISRETFKFFSIYQNVEVGMKLLPNIYLDFASSSFDELEDRCNSNFKKDYQFSYVCRNINLSKADLYFYYKMSDEAINALDKESLANVPNIFKNNYYDILYNIDCNKCTSDTLNKYHSLIEDSNAEILLLIDNYDNSERRLDYIRLFSQAALINYIRNGANSDYISAKLINTAKKYFEKLNFDKFSEEAIALNLTYLIIGHCDYLYDQDKRCDEFNEPTNYEIETFVKEVSKRYSSLNKELIPNLRVINSLIGGLAIDYKNKNDTESLLRLEGYIAPGFPNDVNDFNAFFCDKDRLLCDIDILKIDLARNLEDLGDNISGIFGYELKKISGTYSSIADKYQRLGNTQEQYKYLAKSIEYLIDYYGIVDFETKTNLLNEIIVISDLTNFIKLTKENIAIEIDGIYEPGFDIIFDKNQAATKFINFYIDGKGSNISCDRVGIKKYYELDDGTKSINPFYCQMPFYTYPLLQFKNIKKNSFLDKEGVVDGDWLIAINDYQLDAFHSFNHYSLENIEKIAMELLSSFKETSLTILKNKDYDLFSKISIDKNNNIDSSYIEPANAERIKFVNNLVDKKNPKAKTYLESDLAFKVAQLLMHNKASDSYEKMKKRLLFDNDLKKSNFKRIQDIQSNKKSINQTILNYQSNIDKSINLQELRDRLKILKQEEKEILKNDQDIALIYNSNEKKIYSLKEIVPLIKKDEILAMYIESWGNNFLFLITGGENSYISIDFSIRYPDQFKDIDYSKMKLIYSYDNNDLREKIIEDIYAKIKKNKDTDFLDFYHYGKYLTRNLFARNANNLYEKNKIIFISNIKNSNLPISILPSLSNLDESKSFFIDQFVIKNLFSLSSFEVNKNRINDKKNLTFLGVADPVISSNSISNIKTSLFDLKKITNLFRDGDIADLASLKQLDELPETSFEVSGISKNFNKSRLLTRENATETNIKKMDLSQYDIINFATHSIPVFDSNTFNQPGLVLSLPQKSTNIDDGFLTPDEISKLNLNAKIVILSACNTASGNKDDNEILSGLAQAFLYAGAESVIVSHWPVESRATAILMNEFFDNWIKRDLEVSESLSLAKIYIRENFPEYSHPAYWGAFSYYGL